MDLVVIPKCENISSWPWQRTRLDTILVCQGDISHYDIHPTCFWSGSIFNGKKPDVILRYVKTPSSKIYHRAPKVEWTDQYGSGRAGTLCKMTVPDAWLMEDDMAHIDWKKFRMCLTCAGTLDPEYHAFEHEHGRGPTVDEFVALKFHKNFPKMAEVADRMKAEAQAGVIESG